MYNIYFITGAIVLLLFTVLVAFILIRTKMSYVLKFLLIPTLFTIILGTIHVFEVSYGRPFYGYPTGEWELLNFRNTKDNEAGFIELWVIERGVKDSRVYKIPYDEETQKQL